MAFGPKQMALIVAFFGIVSFILGVFAEIKKPPSGTAIPGKGVVICKYPSDPTVVLGYLSVIFLAASSVVGCYSLFYPYKGKYIPQSALFSSTLVTSFFNISLGTTGLAIALIVWPTITEHLYLIHNTHKNLLTECPTAKTGLIGGGALMSLDACLFWLLSLMFVSNVREDYFEEAEKNEVSQVGGI